MLARISIAVCALALATAISIPISASADPFGTCWVSDSGRFATCSGTDWDGPGGRARTVSVSGSITLPDRCGAAE